LPKQNQNAESVGLVPHKIIRISVSLQCHPEYHNSNLLTALSIILK